MQRAAFQAKQCTDKQNRARPTKNLGSDEIEDLEIFRSVSKQKSRLCCL